VSQATGLKSVPHKGVPVQTAFYEWMHQVRKWVRKLPRLPHDVDEARLHPEFTPLFQRLPDPLQIPFELELESILAADDREVDSTEQS